MLVNSLQVISPSGGADTRHEADHKLELSMPLRYLKGVKRWPVLFCKSCPHHFVLRLQPKNHSVQNCSSSSFSRVEGGGMGVFLGQKHHFGRVINVFDSVE